jgi:hypothetical protein
MKLIKVDDIYTLMDGDKMIASSDSDFQTDYEVMKLSKENCDEIFGVVDVGALALEECNNTDPLRLDSQKYKQDPYFRIGYLKGFNKAIELNKDKLFTVDDLYRAFLINSAGNNTTLRNFFEQTVLPMFEQPKEIEVEIEMETKQQLVNGYRNQNENVIGFIAEYESVLLPKLDENGCLILKKK